jgi:hypothetical protein
LLSLLNEEIEEDITKEYMINYTACYLSIEIFLEKREAK